MIKKFSKFRNHELKKYFINILLIYCDKFKVIYYLTN